MAAKLARERATDNLVDNLLPQVTFTEPPNGSILCFLCKEILRNPMQLSCGHRVCQSCNEHSIPTNNGERRCPDDGELIERTFPDRSALTDIMNLDCYCLAQLDGCNWQGLLLDLEDHVNNCEFFVQLPCPFHDFQCKFLGSKSNMEKHLREDSVKHDCLLATSLSEVMNIVEQNNIALNNTKEKTVEIQKAFIEAKKELLTLQNKLQETSVIVNSQDMNSEKLKDQYKVFEELLSSSENKKTKFVEFHNKVKDLVQKVDNQMRFLDQSEQGSSDKETGVNSKKTLVEKVKRLEESNKAHEKQIADLGIKIRIFQCSSNDGNYTWKLDNLANRLSDARSGKVSELYTPPLYTSSFGYKFSAKIMLDGEKDKVANNSANHIAFYIVIMQGDFDEILEFPFPYPIVITLMNTSNKPNIPNITHTLYPDPNKVHFQKPYKNMNPAIGFARFCSHEKLQNAGFIRENSIYFKIKVDKTGINIKEPNI